MSYPEWDVEATDKELIKQFYQELFERYPGLREVVEENDGYCILTLEILNH